MIGVTAGYNWQLPYYNLVAGVEGDIAIGDISGDDGKRIYDGHFWYTGWGTMATLRGRLGYAMGQNLFYGTAAAVDSDEYIIGNTVPESTDTTGWRGGWVVGLGVERQFTDRISGKVEYLHTDFGSNDGHDGNGEPYTFDNTLDMIRVGVNYKMN